MGGCFSVSLSCDQMVNQVCQWLCLRESYIHNLAENLESLKKAMGLLTAKRNEIEERVNREEFTRRRHRLGQVQVWLTSVLTIENQFDHLDKTSKDELQKLCMCSFCSKNLRESYRYGKRVVMMLREVESLRSQGQFVVVTEAAPVAEVEEMPIQPTIVGQETLLERVWNRLMEDEVGIVGLYGMGGVGKTTVLTQINNKFTENGGKFDIFIWIVVSNGATIHKIQEDIAKRLGLREGDWDKKEENERALDIYNVLRKQKFVLLLDDIWEKVNLKAVGIPYPSRENGCKIAFTTRSREVCGRMGVDDPIEVRCLDSNKAWDLFRKKVGVNTLESHPDIPQLARKIASKCRGLPLALNVIGETMASKTTIQEWHYALDVLTSSAAKFSGMENEILPILKYSYDNLNDEQMKSCFLYCSLYPGDYIIEKKRLIDYWICEGFIDEKENRERSYNQGYEIIGTLIRASLLLEGTKNKSIVAMHDVIREMAIWISSNFGKNKDQCIVQARVGLHEVPKVKSWRDVKRMSLMNNWIEKIVDSPECPQLTTLLLQGNEPLVTISGEFFRFMPHILVLDLSLSINLFELPEEISELVSLRFLDLSYTSIIRLPLGLENLKMLIHLNLESTKKLESLNGISNLSSLRTFRLQDSKMMLDMSLMKELERLEHLEYITTDISSSLIGEQLLYDSKVWRCIHQLGIEDFPKESVRILILPTMANFVEVFIRRCQMSEIKIEKTIWNKTPFFSNLSSFSIHDCNGVKDLTWLLFAPNLTRLKVSFLKQGEAIISEEKAASVLETKEIKQCKIVPFRKLEYIDFFHLRMLKSIYWSSLPFPCLKEIKIKMCPNLKKLPLDSQSVLKVEEFCIKYREKSWIENIEWEDEATRICFLSSVNK